MLYILPFALFFTCYEAQTDVPSVDYCASGCTGYFDGCNSCGCEDGETTFCTLRACFIDELEESYGTISPFTCPENCKTVDIGCNKCECFDTYIKCPKGCDSKCLTVPADSTCTVCPEGYVKTVAPSCVPGWPSCDAPYPFCTAFSREVCAACFWGELWDEQTQSCVSSLSECSRFKNICPCGCNVWNDGCNSCTCDHLTGLHSCTEKACLEFTDPFCEEENKLFEGRCNQGREICVCNENREVKCTRCEEGACRCRGNRVWSVNDRKCIPRFKCRQRPV